MEDGDLFQRLRDVHLPPPPPDGSMLMLVAAGVAAVIIVAAIAALLALSRGGWRAEMLGGLRQAADAPPGEALAGAAKMLRRVAILRTGEGAARLTGPAWLRHLDALFRTRFFTEGPGQVFGDGLYGREAELAAKPAFAGLVRLARRRRFLPW